VKKTLEGEKIYTKEEFKGRTFSGSSIAVDKAGEESFAGAKKRFEGK
jgi:hypothetical protein